MLRIGRQPTNHTAHRGVTVYQRKLFLAHKLPQLKNSPDILSQFERGTLNIDRMADYSSIRQSLFCILAHHLTTEVRRAVHLQTHGLQNANIIHFKLHKKSAVMRYE